MSKSIHHLKSLQNRDQLPYTSTMIVNGLELAASTISNWPLTPQGFSFAGFYTTPARAFIQSTHANDTAAGTGARSIRLIGLNEKWEMVEEVVPTNGLGLALSTTTFARVSQAKVETSGTYSSGTGTGSNIGIITIRNLSPGNIINEIRPQEGCSQNCHFTIPKGQKGFIKKLTTTTTNTSAGATIRIYKRSNASVTSGAVHAPQLISSFVTNTQNDGISFEAMPEIEEMSDIWVSAVTVTGTALVFATMEVLLI